MGYLTSLAVIDETQTYRYWLFRQWDDAKPNACFVMLNPSTADGHVDDATIRRCVGFAKTWGFGSLSVVNLYALRARNPKRLKEAADPIGPENERFIRDAISKTSLVILAWGSSIPDETIPKTFDWIKDACDVAGLLPRCLGRTEAGHPKHPLFLRATIVPEPF